MASREPALFSDEPTHHGAGDRPAHELDGAHFEDTDPEDPLLHGLDQAQRRAVVWPDLPLRIIAGAGAGKTRVLTRRVAYQAASGAIDPRRVVVVTFTRKAASELNNRLRAVGVRDTVVAGTFHGLAYAQLRSMWSDTGRRPPALLERKAQIVARVLPRELTNTAVFDVITEIEWAKARLISPERYEAEALRANRNPSAPLHLLS